MTFYLLDSKPARESFYRTRLNPILAVVVHVTAGLQGRPSGADSSAERTARYARDVTDRSVSWHSGSDRDSHLRLLPDGYTAFHCRGHNSTTIGHEISKRDTSWSDEDPDWVTGTLEQAADCLRGRVRAHGIPLRRASLAELNYAKANGRGPVGFLAHSDLDPSRRSDPGADFPWSRFLELLRPTSRPPVPTAATEVDMLVVHAPGRATALLSERRLWPFQTNAEAEAFVAAGVPRHALTAAEFDLVDTVSRRWNGVK